MTKITSKDLERIREAGRVTAQIKQEVFPGCDFKEIRDTLEAYGLDCHMVIELESTEVGIIVPEKGILMQKRPIDNNQLGLWGGVLNDGENPLDGAVRECSEEVGISLDGCQLILVEVDRHYHKYAGSGDEAYFTTSRFIVKFDKEPEINPKLDEETDGIEWVKPSNFGDMCERILQSQREFIKRLLDEFCN